jgi:hypothetical protein
VEELKQVQIVILVEGNKRSGLRIAEGGITSIDDILKICRRYLGRRDVVGEDFVGQFGEGEVLPFGFPIEG